MRSWVKIIAVILPTAAAVLLLLLLLIFRRFRHRKLLTPAMVNPHTADSPSDAETQTHHHDHRHHRHAVEEESPHRCHTDPDLAAEAAEKGWSQFTFDHCTSCKTSSAFMQTVRLNPDASHGDGHSICSARMRCPLPGPPSDCFSFPWVAYFEITILYLKLQPKRAPSSRDAGKRATTAGSAREDDRTKLIGVNSIEVAAVQEPIKREEGKHKQLGLCLGLTRGDPPPYRWPPGTYPGSIGFQANGSIYLDGMKLVPAYSEKTGWAEANKVIGCGFDPSKKKVFFTVDSELVHGVRCVSDAYNAPLFPAVAADTDVMVLVNLGQRKFKYELANACRTPNPCAIVHEEKQVLFSEDRMESVDTGCEKGAKQQEEEDGEV